LAHNIPLHLIYSHGTLYIVQQNPYKEDKGTGNHIEIARIVTCAGRLPKVHKKEVKLGL